MITKATKEGGDANYYEFRNTYGSMAVKYYVNMKTLKFVIFALKCFGILLWNEQYEIS